MEVGTAKSPETMEVVRGTGDTRGRGQVEIGMEKNAGIMEVLKGRGPTSRRGLIEVGAGTAEIFLGKQARRSQTRRV